MATAAPGILSARNVRRNIHIFMENPDNQNSRIINNVNNQMLFVMVNSHRRLELRSLGRDYRGLRQGFKFVIHPQ